MLRLQCLWYSCSILLFSSTIISNQYHNQFSYSLSLSLFASSRILFSLSRSLSLSSFLLSFFCSYRKRAQNERTNEREESWWMSSVYVYIRVTCMSKSLVTATSIAAAVTASTPFFSSYNNYRTSSLMYLLACWYSLLDSIFTSIQPPNLFYYYD
jgi:hypothetical protein